MAGLESGVLALKGSVSGLEGSVLGLKGGVLFGWNRATDVRVDVPHHLGPRWEFCRAVAACDLLFLGLENALKWRVVLIDVVRRRRHCVGDGVADRGRGE